MSWHPVLVEAIEFALDQIFNENRYADKILEKLFKQNRKFGSRDRKLVAETVYDIVRYIRKYEFVAEDDQWMPIIVASILSRGQTLPKFINDFDEQKILNRIRLLNREPLAIRESYPDWLVELMQKKFGKEADTILSALNIQAEVFLRANQIKTDRATLIAELKKEDILCQPVESTTDGVKLVERKNVFTTQAFKKGFFEVQDAGSQMIAPLLAPKPGERIVDACAGAGGKTLHLAAMMKNRGKIISMDIHQWKLDELRTRCSRNGIDIVETKIIESSKTVKRMEGSFDGVLLDVPCSGIGVLKRNPDSKWKLSLDEISRLEKLQEEILNGYSKMAKIGGRMVYATCSILPEENQIQVQKFLSSENGKGWTLENEISLMPHVQGFDGFYAAKLVRNS